MTSRASLSASARRLAAMLALACWAALSCVRSHAANPVLQWHGLMLDAIRAETTGPTLSSRNLAILSLALFDTINSAGGRHQSYLFTNAAPQGLLPGLAASAAARHVMLHLYPGMRAAAESLFQSALQESSTSSMNALSIAWGEQVALVHLQSRDADGSQTEIPYIPNEAPGQWRRTPPFFRPPFTPHWRRVRPFAISSAAAFRSPPPPSLVSRRYAMDFNQVKELGAAESSTRTGEQTEIARFWSDFSYTAMPPGHWNEIAIGLAAERGLDIETSARLMALLGIAQADAAIACWESKYEYNTWRPVTAIQRADEDGNDATGKDASWAALLPAPPFPEYTSGHSAFSAAAAAVLAECLGTDQVSFTARSDALPGVTRSFTSLGACVEEIGMSRIYGGIHFMTAVTEGKRIGHRIGHYVSSLCLQPIDTLPKLIVEGARDGRLQLRVLGSPGRRHTLESSSNLATWRKHSEILGVLGGAFAEVESTGPELFFRAIESRQADGGIR